MTTVLVTSGTPQAIVAELRDVETAEVVATRAVSVVTPPTITVIGVGPTAPAAGGSGDTGLVLSQVTKSANYTALATDEILLGNTAAGTVTVTLPIAASVPGRIYALKKITADANALRVAFTSGEAVEGQTDISLDAQWAGVTLLSTEAGWLFWPGDGVAFDVGAEVIGRLVFSDPSHSIWLANI